MSKAEVVVSQAEFARVIGRSRGHVADLKRDGLLAMDESGRKVLVVQSLYEVTKREQVLVSQSAFAVMHGWQRSFVTKLKKADRLVMVSVEGKKSELVDVGASLERIALTEPRKTREDVKQRHVEQRGNEPTEPDADKSSISMRKAIASMKLEESKAATAEAEHRKLIGELVEVSDVRAAGAELGTMLRSALENMQDQASAELAVESDPAKCHALLGTHIEHLLRELGRKIEKMGEAKA